MKSLSVVSNSANGAFIKLAEYFSRKELPDGMVMYTSAPRGQKINEFLNATITVANPMLNVVYVEPRKISKKYLVAEFLWYLGARQDKSGADEIVQYAKFWDNLRNPDGSLNSNYGFYTFQPMHNVIPVCLNDYTFNSQFYWIAETLKRDKDSRQVVLNINNITHKAYPTKDFPCTVYLQFFIRDDKLHMFVNMRSCDVVLGYCNDFFQFSMFQLLLRNTLLDTYPDLLLGDLTFNCGSLHVYERHFEMLREIAEMPAPKVYNYSDMCLNTDMLDDKEFNLPIAMSCREMVYGHCIIDEVLNNPTAKTLLNIMGSK